ncbi:MAG TPA: molybdopterin-binding protein [Polyangiaceae bacterium]|nr:molybdopterin-binding protein [Polyangiaceae bacterium]
MIEPRVVQSAAALVIGGEILSGKIRDDNSHFLAKALRALGIELRHIAVVPDQLERIAAQVTELRSQVDVLFTSGGVGPTHDDVTIDAVAQALGREVVEDATLLELLAQHHGPLLTEAHRRLARIPKGAQLLRGGEMRWPTMVVDGVWLLPGVPELFRSKLAMVREYLSGPEPYFSESLLVSAEETEIKSELDAVVARHPGVEIGSYPKWFDPRYKTRITFDSRSAEASRAASGELRELLGGRIVDSL